MIAIDERANGGAQQAPWLMGGNDWDATVREAFFEACLLEGVRAELATRSRGEKPGAPGDAVSHQTDFDAARRAALGWLTIETTLERFGELAALALERCIEEASLQIKRASSLPPRPLRPGMRGPSQRDRDEVALSIVERGRQRLMRFRGGQDFRAA